MFYNSLLIKNETSPIEKSDNWYSLSHLIQNYFLMSMSFKILLSNRFISIYDILYSLNTDFVKAYKIHQSDKVKCFKCVTSILMNSKLLKNVKSGNLFFMLTYIDSEIENLLWKLLCYRQIHTWKTVQNSGNARHIFA